MANVNPVICFFENEKYIYSTEYEILLCDQNESVTTFLDRIQTKYFEKMKVIQVNFDAYFKNLTSQQKSIYKNAKAAVFVLHSFEYKTWNQIVKCQDVKESNKTTFELLTSKNKFIEDVLSIKSMIANGRFYQVNLTCAFKSLSQNDPFHFFLSQSTKYTGNYKCFLPFRDHSLISFSPELFLEKRSSLLKTQPIKGSIAKDKNSETDLLKSEKEQAELSMIVDLLRNDLNSLETTSSAQVTKHREVMNLNYIQHTYSEIEIKTSKSMPFILEQMMPGGSISGCPKKESLIVITELEETKRAAYTGTMGWWQKDDFSLNIAIRTFVQTEDAYYYFAGCGIVYDSDPEKEFSELLNKTGALDVRYQ